MKKIKTNNEKRFNRVLMITFFLIVIVLAIIIPIALSNNSGNVKFQDISSKESEKLKLNYEADGKKEEFLELASKIQNSVSMEILNSGVVDQNSLKDEIKLINKELKKNTWKRLNMDNPIDWIGTWKIESDGSVKFKFLKKSIEPAWINDEDVISYIYLNS